LPRSLAAGRVVAKPESPFARRLAARAEALAMAA
jgi:hypothetical protein